MPDSITAAAPAKLNLALAVDAAGADGLHPICSWMVPVTLHDELEVKRLPDDRLSRYAVLWHPEARRVSEIDWSVRDDLAVRAHLALEAHTGRRLPVQLKLSKRIPVGGGLGGGSSDAATMLRVTRTMFDLDVSDDALLDIAAALGADVPFFLRHRSALVEGTGDVLTTTSAPELHAVIIMPEAQCPTGAVYRRFDDSVPGAFRADDVRSLAHGAQVHGEALFNDLGPAAIAEVPALADHVRSVRALADRPVHVTGSGACLFVVADEGLHASALADAIGARLSLAAVSVTIHEPQGAECDAG